CATASTLYAMDYW
nr:immunoglobulin heavy chain junction region [Mus musculus]